MKSEQVNVNRLIGMWFSSVLNCVCINSQLMDLSEQNRVTVFSSEYFGIQVPALRIRPVVTAISRVPVRRHLQSATRTNSFLQRCHERNSITLYRSIERTSICASRTRVSKRGCGNVAGPSTT